MIYLYIIESDIDYIDNRCVICCDKKGMFIAEPLIPEMADHFANYERFDNDKSAYKYFIIPSDMVSAISHYAGFVKEALIHLSFNVPCGYSTAIVEGEDVQTPFYINHIPCSCTHWTDDGLQLLEACVENWNTSNPLKQMVEPYKFESYNELIAFRDGQI